MDDTRKPVDLVLEGGGVKGVALLGAALEIVDAGYRFARIAGTSAGAVVAALLAAYERAGRDLHDLEQVMVDLDYQRFADRGGLGKVAGPAGEAFEVLAHGGGHSGDYLAEWLTPLLAAAGVRTFADLELRDPEAVPLDYQRYSLVVHVTDLSRRALVRLPWDYSHYGKKAGEQPVVDAVRASMSIPLYFRPVQVETPAGTVTWVDGGVLANYPITVFDRTDGVPPRWPTWGIRLAARPEAGPDTPVRSAPAIALDCVGTVTADWNRYRLDEEGVSRRTVYVDTGTVSAVDFGISRERRQELFERGREAAARFLRQQTAAPRQQVS
ncbi:patatin-like phospholipase family protein [Amycolatopsis sp. NPDC003865]